MNHERLITNILDRYNISYWTEGKNVSENSVNIQCPFYSCGDHSNHMGIFTDSLFFNCWKCGRKGHFSFLLKILTKMSDSECQAEIEEEKILLGLSGGIKEDKSTKESITPLPEYFEKVDERIKFPLLFKYLKRRKISIDQVIEKGCGICRVGHYMNRMIIPIYFEGEQVSFVAADLTGTAKLKYDMPGDVIKYLYGYDDVEGDTIIITEGILDTWRIQDNSMAMLGSYLTDFQKSLILRKHPRNLIFCLDGDAYWHARDESTFFEPFVDRVAVIRMDFEEDPDSLGTDKIWSLIEEQIFSQDEDPVF